MIQKKNKNNIFHISQFFSQAVQFYDQNRLNAHRVLITTSEPVYVNFQVGPEGIITPGSPVHVLVASFLSQCVD